LSKISSQG
jgi:hypothetical protein